MKINVKFTKLTLAVVAGVALSAFAGTASAGSATSNLGVTATVAANCTIDASSGLGFGTYDPTSTNAATALDATGNITATCTSGATASIKLDLGANAGAGTQRAMKGSKGGLLNYNLYTDSARTAAWDDVASVSVTADGTAQTIPVYGSIPAAQNVAIDSYTDTVVATISF